MEEMRYGPGPVGEGEDPHAEFPPDAVAAGEETWETPAEYGRRVADSYDRNPPAEGGKTNETSAEPGIGEHPAPLKTPVWQEPQERGGGQRS